MNALVVGLLSVAPALQSVPTHGAPTQGAPTQGAPTQGAALLPEQARSAQARGEQALTPLADVGGPAQAGTVRIGQHIEWRIRVDGAALGRDQDERAREKELLDLGFVLLDGPTYDGDSARRYTLLALDPGQRTTPELELALAGGGLAVAPAATIEVLGELAADEDAPRPARGFRSVEDRAVLSPGALGAVLGALALVAGGAFALVRLRRRAGPARPADPTPAERLQALSPELPPAQLAAALGPLVRALVDRAEGQDRDALTDAEWRARLALAPDVAARAADLVERSSAARFSGRAPSMLGAKEWLAEARSLATELAATPRGGDA